MILMSSDLLPQSHRPTPPISPPVDNNKHSPIMNSRLPNTPQSPTLAGGQLSIPSAAAREISDQVSTSTMSDSKMQLATGDEPTANPGDATNKRKREADDDGGQEQKKVHIENGTPGIEELHRDVGSPYRLASTPYPKAAVDLTIDLFKAYSLEAVAAHVARGGPKPMKMGKTYKKHMRTMMLSGKFDAVKKGEDDIGLYGMLQMPDQEWGHAQTLGRNIQNGLGSAARSNLAQAMSMSKGRLPKNCFDPSVLALTDPVPPVAAANKSASTIGLNRKTPGQITTAGATAPPVRPVIKTEQPRPQRNIKKRTYTDDGFEGYGEGYADDNMADDGAFRPGDEDRQQLHKKDSSTYHFSSLRQHASYGPGTVGA